MTRARSLAGVPLGVWGAGALAAAVLLPPLPVDETRYLSVAWEMWREGSWLVPVLDGRLYLHKTPLLFWLIQLAWSVGGVGLLPARLVVIGFAGLAAVVVAHLVRAAGPRGERVGAVLLAGCLALTPVPMLYGIPVMFESLLIAGVAAAILAIHRLTTSGSEGWALAYAVALAAALFAKGPIAILLVLPFAAFAPLAADRRRRGRIAVHLALASVAALVPLLVWLVVADGVEGRQVVGAAVRQIAERTMGGLGHPRPWWYHLAWAPVLLLPWSVWPRWWRALRAALRSRDPVPRWLAGSAATAVVLLSSISNKQPHYALSAWLIVSGIGLAWIRRVPAARGDLLAAAAPLAVGAALAIAGAVGWLGPGLAHDWFVPMLPVVAVLLAGALALVIGARRIAPRDEAPVIAVAYGGLLLGLAVALAATRAEAFDLTPAARRLAAAEAAGRPIAFVGRYDGQFHFLGRLRRSITSLPADRVTTWLATHPGGVVAGRRDRVPPSLLAGGTFFEQPYRGRHVLVVIEGPNPDFATSSVAEGEEIDGAGTKTR